MLSLSVQYQNSHWQFVYIPIELHGHQTEFHVIFMSYKMLFLDFFFRPFKNVNIIHLRS